MNISLEAYEKLSDRITELMLENERLRKIVLATQQWISVKDRLPEPGSYVLVFTNDYCDYTAHYDGYWWLSGEEPTLSYEVTHWMPLPAPPEVEDAID